MYLEDGGNIDFLPPLFRPPQVCETTYCVLHATEEAVRTDWERQGRIFYYDKYCFDQCWARIWKWIKVQPVTDVLMRYNLIDITNIHRVSGEHLGAKEMADNLLLEVIPKAGCYGYYLLYIAIRDSMSSNPIGHSQAVQELKKYGEHAHVLLSMCVAMSCRGATSIVIFGLLLYSEASSSSMAALFWE